MVEREVIMKCALGTQDRKSQSSLVKTRLRMWPATCVGTLTCRLSTNDSIICKNWETSGFSGRSTCMLKSPVISSRPVLIQILVNNSDISSKKTLMGVVFLSDRGGRCTIHKLNGWECCGWVMIVVRCSNEWKATSSGQFCLTDSGSLKQQRHHRHDDLCAG